MRLDGCGVDPIGDYLKALGALKAISEQADPNSTGHWVGDRFHLDTQLGEGGVLRFFSEYYEPAPIVAPWNSGNGLKPESASGEWSEIIHSSAPRLREYALEVVNAQDIMRRSEAWEEKGRKNLILRACRNTMGDRALEWLDSAYMELDGGRIGFPPISGTGGNDGRMDFSRNFAKSITEVMLDDGTPSPKSVQWLKSSLFGEIIDSTPKKNVGMYRPFSIGGYNQSSSGYQSPSFTNPWDYILMMEGILLMNSSAVRRLESHEDAMLASPWTVRHSNIGYSNSPRDEEKVRAEIWLPLWGNPSRLSDIRGLMSEGRVELGERPARNGIDFFQAISRLGVDRGIYRFHRYAAAERNGQAHLLLSAGRADVFRRGNMDLISEISPFVDSLRRLRNDGRCPAGLLSDIRGLENSLMRYMSNNNPGSLLEVLLCVGDCHLSLSRSLPILKKENGEGFNVRPVKRLSHKWLEECYNGTAEYRLASSIASVYQKQKDPEGGTRYYPLHENIFPMRKREWDEKTRDVVWNEQDLIPSLIRIMSRRMTQPVDGETRGSSSPVVGDVGNANHSLEDISLFLGNYLDSHSISRMTAAFSLVRQDRGLGRTWKAGQMEFVSPPANYSVLKLCHSNVGVADKKITLDKKIFRLLAAGRSAEAVSMACHRLGVSGLPVSIFSTRMSAPASRLLAASLIIPDSQWISEVLLRDLIPDHSKEVA